jgi:3-hydroxyacyl-CoA dehydrogenase
MKLNNQIKHELGMIDDNQAEESTFEKMVDEFSLGRKPKHNGGRKYSIEKKSKARNARLAKKARQEQRAREHSAAKALDHQLLHNKINKI